MKLLFVSPYTPVKIRTRPHHFLRFLARRDIEITLATVYENASEQAFLETLRGDGLRVISVPAGRAKVLVQIVRALLSGMPIQSRYSWDAGLAEKVVRQHREEPFDVVHLEHLRGAVYGTFLQQNAAPRLPVVWDSVDSISHLFSQAAQSSVSRFGKIVSRVELGRTRKYESDMVRRFDRVLVTSEQDRQALLDLSDEKESAKIFVIPNGVDVEAFYPIDDPPQQDTIIFTGKMSYHANVTAVVRFVREVMPHIWNVRPGVELQVVGKDPARQVQHLGEDRRIIVVGAVNEMRPFLGKAAVSVAPIAYGAGIQNKVLEAMACRTPVVASPQAVAALQAMPGRDVLVANDPQVFAAEVVRILEDDVLRAAVASAGYKYVLENHRWEDAVARLEDVYNEAIQSIH